MKKSTLRIFLAAFLLAAVNKVFAQTTYDVYIANRALTSSTTMEFDVYIKSNGSTASWPMRSYQAGYQFSSAFVNGGTLSGQYVSGSSELTETTFGKTWGFSWNSANRVLNQSANTGSACPGASIGSLARKICRVKVTNTVNWGCADDAIAFKTSGSGYLLLAITRYGSADCSDATAQTITSGATSYTSSPNESLLKANISGALTVTCNGTTSLTISGSGGVSPYTGTSTVSVGEGSYSYTVTDARGCTASAGATVTTAPDVTAPVISTCAANQSFTANSANVPDFTSGVIASDNCTASSSLVITQSPAAGTSVGIGVTTVTITVADASNNTSTCSATFTVNEPCNVSASVSTSAVTCFNGSNGSATITLSGAGTTSSGSYTVNSGSSQTYSTNPFTISGLAGGSYSVSITSGNCPANASFSISAPGSAITSSFSASACGSYTLPWGPVVTSSGSYNHTYTSVAGCDSTVTAVVTITPFNYISSTQVACDSYTWSQNGQTYTQSGSYTADGTGCDKYVLNLTITTSTTNSTTASACSSYTWNVNGQTYTQSGSYSSVSGCNTQVLNLTISSAFSVDAAINGPANSCPHTGTGIFITDATYSINAVSASGFTWTVPAGATLVSGQSTNTIKVRFATTFTSGNIAVTVTTNCGSPAITRSLTVTKGTAPAAPTAIAGPVNVCDYLGSATLTATYTVNPVAGAAGYNWTIPLNVTRVSASADSSSITLRFASAFSANASKVLSVRAVNGCGTSAAFSLTLATTVPANVTAVTGPVNVCNFLGNLQNVTYTANPVAGASRYRWVLPTTNVTLVSATSDSSSITVRFASAFSTNASKVITVRGVNGCGVSATAFSLTLTTVVLAAPTAIAGPVNVCNFLGAGTDVTYTANAVTGALRYRWTIPTTNVTLVSAAADSSSITVRFASGFLTNASKAITVRTVNGCGVSSTAFSLTLTTVALAAPTAIAGPVNVCNFLGNSTQATYTANPVAGALRYRWTLPLNVTLVSANADSSSINVTFASGFLTNASKALSVRTVNGCGVSSTAFSLTLTTVAVAAPTSIAGPVNVCNFLGNSTQATYTANPVAGALRYRWTLPLNVTMVSANADSSSINVTFASGFLTNASKAISVRTVNGCGVSSTAFSLTLTTVVLAAPTAIAGPANVCDYLGNGAQATYTANPVAGATGYRWTLPVNVTRVSATPDSSSITVTFASAFLTNASKVISVRTANGCGVGTTAFSLTLVTTVPGTPGAITGPANICMITNANRDTTYRIRKVAGASSYAWTVTAGITILSSPANDTALLVRIASTVTTGTITVKAVNGCGQSATAASLALSKVAPTAPGNISTSVVSTACPNQRVSYFISALPLNTTRCQWTVPAGANIDSITNNSTRIWVTYPAKGSAYSGTVSVVSVNACFTSAAKTATVSVTACAPAFADNNSGNDPEVRENPNADLALGFDVQAFPNPSTSSFNIRALTNGKEQIHVRVLDVQGREYKRFVMMPGETLNLGSDLMTGTYLIEALQAKKMKTVRVIKL